MGIFDNLKKQPEASKAKIEIPATWECAKQITKLEADSKSVPLGWYFYQDGYMWRGIKPDPETGGFNAFSPTTHTPEELEEWLGVPVRKAAAPTAVALSSTIGTAQRQTQPGNPPKQPQPDYLKKMGLAEPAPEDNPPTELENQWAEKILTDELREQSSPADKKPRKKRKSLGRTNQVIIRLTDAEKEKFRNRVEASGLAQGDFLREMAIKGKVVIKERSQADVALMTELGYLRAELGRQGGLLKMVIKPNEGQRQLAPEEWAKLISTIDDLEDMKKRLKELEAKLLK